MINNPVKLLQEAQEAGEKGDFEKVKEIKERFETEEGLIPDGVLEFFESNFDPIIFE